MLTVSDAADADVSCDIVLQKAKDFRTLLSTDLPLDIRLNIIVGPRSASHMSVGTETQTPRYSGI